MLWLILLFWLKNCLWVTRSPEGYQGGIWAPCLVVAPGARAQGIPRGPGPRDPQGPGPKGSPGARAQGIPRGPSPRDPQGPGPKGSPGARVQGVIYSFRGENKVVVQSQKFAILAEFLLNLSPVRRWCNEIIYPRGFSY